MEKLPHPFPTYIGPPLPSGLNSSNPRHYGLLIMWFFFQPSRLRHYLWQADPDLYQATGWKFFTCLRHPAYRKLILMTLLLTLGFAFIPRSVALIFDRPQVTLELLIDQANTISIDFAIAVLIGLFGGALTLNRGIAIGISVGLAVCTSFTFSIALMVIPYRILGIWGNAFVSDIAINFVIGILIGMTIGTGVSIASGIVYGVAVSIVFGAAFTLLIGLNEGVTTLLAVGTGVLISGSRLLFHLVTFPLNISHLFIQKKTYRMSSHPVFWDELAFWPLLGIVEQLQVALSTNLVTGIRYAAHIATNPFQRGRVQRSLHTWLHCHPAPLATLYQLARQKELDAFAFPPASKEQFQHWPTARSVLLSEIGQEFIAANSNNGENSERFVWWLTKRQRQLMPTPPSQFSLLLRDLYEDQTALEADELPPIREDLLNPSRYQGLVDLPGGHEIVHTLDLIRLYLGYETIGDLATAQEALDPLEGLETPLIRPAVVQTLRALGDVSAQVARYQVATSLPRQTTALNLAAGRLQELETYARNEVQPPERVLLIRVVGLWQDIVAEAQGALGQNALRGMSRAEQRSVTSSKTRADIWQRPAAPIDNPYTVGDPVYPPLLAGRTDIFNRIAEVWSAKTNPDSIILFGHRRMGKSSILRNLDQAAPKGSIIVYADMAGETSFVASTSDLLLALADRLHQTLQTHFPEASLPEPDPAEYTTASQAQFHFNRLTGHVANLLDGRILILALDEFEAIEKAVEDGKIGSEIFQFLRTKTQEPWLTLVFGGLHTLDEMSRDYQQPFYGSYTNIRVSYLNHDDAWRLITNPTPDFNLDYDRDAVERIIAETGGQPYLIQQLCRDALDHLNHELFDLDLQRPVRINTANVEAALADDFFRRGMVYFDGIWVQTTNEAQRTMLRTLAQRNTPWTLADLAQATNLALDELRRHLRWAERHDILQKIEGDSEDELSTWRFYVPLMRRWLLNK